MDTILKSILTSYGMSAQQAKENLLGLRRNPQGSIFDFAANVARLVRLEHPYLPSKEKILSLSLGDAQY